MKFKQPQTLAHLATLTASVAVCDDANLVINGINEIHLAVAGDIIFVDHPKYYAKALKSAASVILIDKKVDCPPGKALLVCQLPFDSFNLITQHFMPPAQCIDNTGNGSVISPSAKISPGVVIGHNVTIGDEVILHPGVVIGNNCIIDDQVEIGPNSVIGHYAFYYQKKPQGYARMYTCGGVHLKSRVEIGASCTIDAGVTAMTTIGEGSKLDNQVHVGHDTVIGKNCLFAAQVGLAGCVVVEDNVTMWGQVGCASNIVIGESAIVLGQSGITKNLSGGKTYFGTPCFEVRESFKQLAALRQLPKLIKKLGEQYSSAR